MEIKDMIVKIQTLDRIGMASILFVNENIATLSEKEIEKAFQLANSLSTNINWGFDTPANSEEEKIYRLSEKLNFGSVKPFFDTIKRHFKIL